MNWYSIGALTFPASWLAILAAFIFTAIFLRTVFGKATLEWFGNVFFWFLITWKFSMVIWDFESVMNQPLTLLYFHGGEKGYWLAIIISFIYIFIHSRKSSQPIHSQITIAWVSIIFIFELAIGFLLPRNLWVTLFSGFIMGFLLILAWKKTNQFQSMWQILVLSVVFQFFMYLIYGKLLSTPTISYLLITLLMVILIFRGRIQVSKKTFGFALMALLIGIFIANIVQTQMDEKQKIDDPEDVRASDPTVHGDGSKEGLTKGDLAPDFTLTTLEGKILTLSDLRGKKVILNFWATWCPPCKAEMPHMQKYYKENAKQHNVEVVAVNLTNMDEGNKNIQKFVKDYELTFPVPLDKEGEIGSTYQAFTIPTSYMIDTKGRIQHKIIGPMNEEMMEKMVKGMD
jgi:peroxiredoxin